MLEAVPLNIIVPYFLFKTFVYTQRLHFNRFQGTSKGFEAFLGLSVILGTIGGIVFLIYYAINVTWWAPIVLVLIGLILIPVSAYAVRLEGVLQVSLVGFIGWPFCLFVLFSNLN